ncbi:MAG: PDZ domain-containing protein [Candidatus Dadabacteria bacterium]|nr:PDZ domain-containing protein [Candidatus Dadabacteria bacterium]
MFKNLFSKPSNKISTIIFIVVVTLFLLFNTFLQFSASEKNTTTQIVSPVISYVNKYYIDKNKIEPVEMLKEGLSKLEQIIDEVLIEFPENRKSKNFTVQVMDNRKSFNYKNITDIKDLTGIFDEVFGYIGANYQPPDKTYLEIEYAVVDAILKTLDSNSGIITPKIYKEFMIETEGSFGGLGIVIGIREGQLTVISPIEGTPAYLAGVKSKDKIVQIEDGSTINMSLLEAVSKLRGPKGTKVNIHVMREGFSNPKKFTIKRATIKIESVDAFVLEENILYIKLRDFQKNSLNSIKEKANKLTGDNINSADGIILDLRGNPGGLLEQSKKISDLFLQSGNIVSTQIGNDKKTYSASNDFYEYRGKMVVLVDSGSASASEIVAGALQNNNRALIVGEQTFGKGTVQQIFNLKDNAALKLTIASYLTPGDISIQDIGITPDIALQRVTLSKDNIDLIPNQSRNSDDKDSLQSIETPKHSIKFLEIKTDPEQDLVEEALNSKQKLDKISSDFAVLLSINIIKNSASPDTLADINFIENEINKYSINEEKKISLKLKDLGIDWSQSDNYKNTSEIAVNINKSKTIVKAGDKIDISIDVKNIGSSPIQRLYAVTDSDNPVFNNKEYIFGKISAGQTKTWTNSFEIPKWALSRDDKVELIFKDYNKNTINTYSVNVRTKQLPRPRFAFNYEIIDDGKLGTKGNGNGIPEVNEIIGLKLKLKNIGNGVSEKSTLLLKNNVGEDLYLKKGRIKIEDIKPGEVKEGTFLFSINKPIKNLDLEFQILDDIYREGVIKKIKLEIPNQPENNIKESRKYFANSDNVPILGCHLDNNSIIAYAYKDSIFESLQSNDKWVKVTLDDTSSGWINKKLLTLSTNNSIENSEPKLQPVYQQSPKIALEQLPLLINNNEITLKGEITDADGVKLITVFLGEDKVLLKNFYTKKAVINSQINLNKGINYIYIFAKDINGLISKKTYVVRYDA